MLEQKGPEGAFTALQTNTDLYRLYYKVEFGFLDSLGGEGWVSWETLTSSEHLQERLTLLKYKTHADPAPRGVPVLQIIPAGPMGKFKDPMGHRHPYIWERLRKSLFNNS